jgi:RNA polymerase sigma-70 factor (ECF subfamily)
MGWIDQIRALLPSSGVRRRDEIESDIRQELEFHLMMAAEEAERDGLSPDQATEHARVKFGDFAAVEAACQKVQFGTPLSLQRCGVGFAAVVMILLAVMLMASHRRQTQQRSELARLRNSVQQLEESLVLVAAQLPPVVVETFPTAGAIEVDPTAGEIRVKFSKEMQDQSWSWCQTEHPFPESTGPIHYAEDGRTCILPVRLQPGTKYVLTINSPHHRNFKDLRGQSAPPYVLAFETAVTESAPL